MRVNSGYIILGFGRTSALEREASLKRRYKKHIVNTIAEEMGLPPEMINAIIDCWYSRISSIGGRQGKGTEHRRAIAKFAANVRWHGYAQASETGRPNRDSKDRTIKGPTDKGPTEAATPKTWTPPWRQNAEEKTQCLRKMAK